MPTRFLNSTVWDLYDAGKVDHWDLVHASQVASKGSTLRRIRRKGTLWASIPVAERNREERWKSLDRTRAKQWLSSVFRSIGYVMNEMFKDDKNAAEVFEAEYVHTSASRWSAINALQAQKAVRCFISWRKCGWYCDEVVDWTSP